MDCYSVLQISKNATAQEVKQAYRKIALRYHPDRNPSPEARRKFVEATTAYRLLIDKQGNLIRRSQENSIPPKPDKTMSGRERDNWYRQRNAEKRARGEAEAWADKSFEEFSKTRIFKTAMVLSNVYDYIFLVLGVMLIIAPWVYYWKHEPSEEEIANGQLAFDVMDVTFAAGFGVLFTAGIYTFLFKQQNKSII